ncbi:MAG: hypothetical protein QNJ22_05965 [Desulfosarcinaceae bacterium]|nr:hypothetical protein [Desulfosarcinaceae bacterium]
MHQNRDMGIATIQDRGVHCSGMGLGIILLDETYPGFPGDVRNPSAFPYPIQYAVARGLDIKQLLYGNDKTQYLATVLAAARDLQKMGCRAVLAECGYFARFQRTVAAQLAVPVFMSSLLQVPWAQHLIAPDRPVGILISAADALEAVHLEAVGIRPDSNYVIGDAMGGGRCPEFDRLWTDGIRPDVPAANFERAEAEFLAAAMAFHRQHPRMGAMVLECTGFQPFARALQRQIRIPIFSWGTLMDFAYSVAVHRDYYGHA